MAVPIAELFVSVGADISGATAGLNQLQSTLTRAGSAFNTVGRNLTIGLTAPIVGAGAAVFKVGSEFETAFNRVQKTVNDTDFGDLRKQLLDLSTDPTAGGATATSLANIASIAGQMGIKGADDIAKFSKVVAQLDVTTDNLSVDEIATELGRFATITRTPIDQIDRVGSSITALGNEMNGTEGNILALLERLTGLSALRVSNKDILGIAGTLADLGINAEEGGTAVTRFFVEMIGAVNGVSGPSAEAAAKIQNLQDKIFDLGGSLEVATLRQQEFGRNTPASVVKANELAIAKYNRELAQAQSQLTQTSDGANSTKLTLSGLAKVTGLSEDAFAALVKEDPTKGFVAVVKGLQAISKESGEGGVVGALGDLNVEESRQRLVLLKLALAQSKFVDGQSRLEDGLGISNTAFDENTATTTEVAKAMTTTANKIQLLKNQVEKDLIAAFDAAKPSIDKTVESGNGLTKFLDDLSAKFAALSPDDQERLLTTLGALAILGPGLSITGGALNTIGAGLKLLNLGGGAAGAAGAAGATAGPGAFATAGAIGVFAAAAIFVVDEVANHWDTTKAALQAQPTTAPLADIIQKFKDNGNTIKAEGAKITDVFKGLPQAMDDMNLALATKILTAGGLFSALGTLIKGTFDNVIGPSLRQFEDQTKLFAGLLPILETIQKAGGGGATLFPGGPTVNDLVSSIKGPGTAAPAAGTTVAVTINNPTVTSQELLDQFSANVQKATFNALIKAQQTAPGVAQLPQPIPGTVPGTPF